MANGAGFRSNPLMRLTLTAALVFIVFLWVTNVALYFTKMSMDPKSVSAYYLGDEESYRPPRTAGSMLEVTHGHMAAMALVLLLVTHLYIFVPGRHGAKVAAIVTTFAAALLDEGSGWLVRFVSPAFAPQKVAGFVIFQGSLAWLVARLGWFLWTARRIREDAPAMAEPPGEDP